MAVILAFLPIGVTWGRTRQGQLFWEVSQVDVDVPISSFSVVHCLYLLMVTMVWVARVFEPSTLHLCVWCFRVVYGLAI